MASAKGCGWFFDLPSKTSGFPVGYSLPLGSNYHHQMGQGYLGFAGACAAYVAEVFGNPKSHCRLCRVNAAKTSRTTAAREEGAFSPGILWLILPEVVEFPSMDDDK